MTDSAGRPPFLVAEGGAPRSAAPIFEIFLEFLAIRVTRFGVVSFLRGDLYEAALN